MKLSKILYIVLIVVLLIIFAGSAIYVGNYFYEGHKQQSEYDDLAAIVESGKQNATEATESTQDPTNTEETEAPPPTILPEYQALYEMNPHMVGWISIEDTKINYPVMQTPEEKNFYLYRNFNREKSARGCLYAREECDIFAPSDNITIYGHYMNDGSMFHNLHSYQRKKFWESHDTITFDTLYEHHTYRIFAVFTTTASVGEGFRYHQFIDAYTEEEFNEFVSTCKELAFYETGITPKYGDKFITLSTCEYSQTNGRLVVVAVRVS